MRISNIKLGHLESYLSSILGRIWHAVTINMGTDGNIWLFPTFGRNWCITQGAYRYL